MSKELLSVLIAHQLQDYFQKFGYIGVYVWFITVDQIVPVPEEITLIIIGYFASLGNISPLLAGTFAIAAFLTVDIVYFQLTRSGNKLIKKITGKSNSTKTNAYKEKLKNHTFKTLVVLCFIPRMRLLGPVFVALLKIPFLRFIFYDTCGLCLFTTVYISLGYVFHKSLSSVISKTQSLTNIIFIASMVIMAGLTIFFIRKMRGNKK
jgi:membrane protein DedA with SNARE-associated domain